MAPDGVEANARWRSNGAMARTSAHGASPPQSLRKVAWRPSSCTSQRTRATRALARASWRGHLAPADYFRGPASWNRARGTSRDPAGAMSLAPCILPASRCTDVRLARGADGAMLHATLHVHAMLHGAPHGVTYSPTHGARGGAIMVNVRWREVAQYANVSRVSDLMCIHYVFTIHLSLAFRWILF